MNSSVTKHRRFYFILWILVIVVYSCDNMGNNSPVYQSMKEFVAHPTRQNALKLKIYIPSGKLKDNLAARKELVRICNKYDDFVTYTTKQVERAKRNDILYEQGKSDEMVGMDLEEIRDLIEFILHYPNTVSALTAKLRIAWEFGWGGQYKKSQEITDEVAKEHPNTWQGIRASPPRGRISTPEEISRYKVLDNEQDPEFVSFMQAKLPPWDKNKHILTVDILSGNAFYAASTLKNYDLGIEICRRIISDYPNTYGAKEAKERIESFEHSRQAEKLYNWFRETYRREWNSIEISKYNNFREQFKQQYNRLPNLEEEQGFFQEFMSKYEKEQEPPSPPK